MSETEVRVVNEFGQDVAHNGEEIGEVIVKSPSVINSSKRADQTIVNGWLHTGDMGTIDENGSIRIVNKKAVPETDKHVSTVEVEGIFYEHPAVQEVAVLARPDKALGEVLHAIVVLHDGKSASEQELLEYVKEKLEPASCPKSITLMDELPKTPSGKIQKIKLRESV
ncbi:AMP-binding enzyme [Virgibacillus siamensis]|uniref:AMP-binding enzyme n=1 Tax=Virgibacillus siamensis TaxID=480071 RepID=UPI000984883D|nr:AMP-binding protein [Virgibacillus siamensis]